MARANQARQEAYRERVRLLKEAFLPLGADAPAILADTAAITEAASSVTSAWEGLVALEAQILRERERLGLLETGLVGWDEPKTPPTSMLDLQRADQRKAHVAQVEDARASVEALTAEAKAKRAELEAVAKA